MKKVLLILSSVFLAVYTFGIIAELVSLLSDSALEFSRFEYAFGFLLYLIYITGYILSWSKELSAGIIYLLFYAAVFVMMLFISSDSDGLEIVLGLPALVFGPLFILLGYRQNQAVKSPEYSEWQYVLPFLSSFYLIVYLVFVIAGQTGNLGLAVMKMPALLLLIPLVIFLAAYLASWFRENIAGFLFILWYVAVVVIAAVVPAIGGDGYAFLWALLGLTVLVQGIFYLNWWYRLKPG